MKTGTTPGSFKDENGLIDYEKMRLYGFSCADYSGLSDTKNGRLYHVDDDEFKTILAEEK